MRAVYVPRGATHVGDADTEQRASADSQNDLTSRPSKPAIRTRTARAFSSERCGVRVTGPAVTAEQYRRPHWVLPDGRPQQETHMTANPDESALILAGRPIERDEAWARVLRYCGLPWDDHSPETWAFRYFDLIETDPAVVAPHDVLCAGALHHGLTRDDLTWFWDHRCDLENWLSGILVDQALRTADDATVAALSELPSRFAGPPLSLVTKVLHRKRPWLIQIGRAHV